MVFVLVEIDCFNALRKIDPVLTARLVSDLDKILKSKVCVSKKITGSVFTYGYVLDLPDIKGFFSHVREAYEYLLSIKDDLRGFTVLIDQSEGVLSKIQERNTVRKIYEIWENESLCVSYEAYDLFAEMSEYIKFDTFYKVFSADTVTVGDEENLTEFLAKTEEMEKLLDTFEPLLNNEKRGLFFYYSNELSGIPYIAYSISALLEGDVVFPWLFLFPEDHDYSQVYPFVRCSGKDNFGFVSSFLNGTEKNVWDQFVPLLSVSDISLYEEDAIIIFRLYLAAYSRFLENKNLPFIVYLLDVDRFNERTLEIIAGILEEFLEDQAVIPFLFSHTPDVPACFHNFPVVKYHSDGWTSLYEEVEERCSPVSLFHSRLLEKQHGGVTCPGMGATRSFLDTFDSYTRRILYLSSLLKGLLTPGKIIEFLAEEDFDRIKYEKAFNDLLRYGFLYPEHIRPVFPQLLPELRKIHGEIETSFFKKLFVLYRDKNDTPVRVSLLLADICYEIEEPLPGIYFIFQGVKNLIRGGKTEEAVTLLKEVSHRINGSLPENNELLAIYNQLFLMAALFDSREQLAREFYDTVFSSGEMKNARINLEQDIILSEYYYASYDYTKALSAAKEALLIIQTQGNSPAESSVNFLLGKIMLGTQRIEEAKDYFRIAREFPHTHSIRGLLCEIYYFESVTHYIHGNLSESIRLIRKGSALSGKQGERRWQFFFCFMEGRINFDLGRYADAVKKFSECLTLSEIYTFHESVPVLYRWLARSFLYSGRRKEGKRILSRYADSAEGLFFFSEYFYLEGQYREALRMVEQALEKEHNIIKVFHSPLFDLRESGFEYIEDLVFLMDDGHGVLFHLIQAFKAFLSVLVSPSSHGIEELTRLTRDKKLSDIDPYNGFYFFLHALCITEKPGTDDLDRLTLLSKALRHVQTIASRIDVPAERIDYLNKNHWNSKLLSAGKKNKLL